MAVDVLAIVWGLIIAVCARFIIVSLDLALIAAAITYFVGAVISGTTARLANSPLLAPTDEVQMAFNYMYYKKEVLAVIPRVSYVIASGVLFFVWA